MKHHVCVPCHVFVFVVCFLRVYYVYCLTEIKLNGVLISYSCKCAQYLLDLCCYLASYRAVCVKTNCKEWKKDM